jgi:hypothetical protein
MARLIHISAPRGEGHSCTVTNRLANPGIAVLLAAASGQTARPSTAGYLPGGFPSAPYRGGGAAGAVGPYWTFTLPPEFTAGD